MVRGTSGMMVYFGCVHHEDGSLLVYVHQPCAALVVKLVLDQNTFVISCWDACVVLFLARVQQRKLHNCPTHHTGSPFFICCRGCTCFVFVFMPNLLKPSVTLVR